MIEIDQDRLIGKGGSRLIYEHPDDELKVIKVFNPSRTPQAQKRQSKWYKSLQPAVFFDVNIRDMREHTRARSKGAEVAAYICQTHGIVATNMGAGLVCDFIKEDNGQASPTLLHHVQQHGTHGMRALIDKMFTVLAKNHVLFRDANSRNILLCSRGNEQKLIVVDGLGESNLVPYASVFKGFNARKLARKKDRLLIRLELEAHKKGRN